MKKRNYKLFQSGDENYNGYWNGNGTLVQKTEYYDEEALVDPESGIKYMGTVRDYGMRIRCLDCGQELKIYYGPTDEAVEIGGVLGSVNFWMDIFREVFREANGNNKQNDNIGSGKEPDKKF